MKKMKEGPMQEKQAHLNEAADDPDWGQNLDWPDRLQQGNSA